MNQSSALISVILPVKNGDLTLLKRALSSVHAQSYSNYEILLIDDQSDEDYAKELDLIAAENKKIRLFHIPASGVSGARNFAAERAQGDILTYLDSDDELSSFCFEEAATLLKDSTVDILWGGTFYGSAEEIKTLKDSLGKTCALSETELSTCTISLNEDRLHQTRAECIGEPFRFENGGYINRGIAARFIKKECFDNAHCLFPLGIKMYEDAIWNLKMLEDFHILYVKSIWYYYLNNEASVSNIFHDDTVERMEVPLKEIHDILDLNDPTEYTAYTRLLMDSLRYVYKCLYGNSKWKSTKGEKKNLKHHLYNDLPWSELASTKALALASPKDKFKAQLFKHHLLFFYWKLKAHKM